MKNKNPLLSAFNTPHKSIPFDKIEAIHFLPAIEVAIENASQEIEAIKSVEHSTFENVIEALEKSGKLLNTVSGTFFNLNSAESNDDFQSIAGEFSAKMSAFSSSINTSEVLFKKIEEAKSNTLISKLSNEQKTLLDKTYKQFVRNGALLNDKDKKTLIDIDHKLAQLTVTFGQNLLNDTNNYLKVFDNVKDLDGLPSLLIEQAKQLAESKQLKNKWAVSLDYPSYIPFITYANNREFREELFIAYAKRAFDNNEFNNKNTLEEIARYRLTRAKLLGFSSHAEFVLAERMASTPIKVHEFLDNLLEKALPKAKEQVNEVAIFASENGATLPLQRWDFSFWSEKLKQKKYQLDDEILKPYFKLENVLDGVYKTANKLFGLKFKPVFNVPKYHKDVQTFEVFDAEDNFIALFYADFFPREGKRSGAWMTSYKGQCIEDNINIRPHVSIVCNFSKPTESEPSLLTFQEVRTLFHEFGHALHGMLANGKYESLSGTNVYWDFVELPSQLFENWIYEKECLELFAFHYKTGKLIPEEYITAIKNSIAFLEGYQTIRQLSFARLDMKYHDCRAVEKIKMEKIEQDAFSKTELFPPLVGAASSPAFAHIFSGGYSAGYYSYKWAEVLDADAFEVFLKNGIFNKEVAKKFKQNILEKGGTQHPMILYKNFKGAEPKINALLKRANLL